MPRPYAVCARHVHACERPACDQDPQDPRNSTHRRLRPAAGRQPRLAAGGRHRRGRAGRPGQGRARAGRPHPHVAAARRASRPAGRSPALGRSRARCAGGHRALQLGGVRRDPPRRVQAACRARQRELPLPGGRARGGRGLHRSHRAGLRRVAPDAGTQRATPSAVAALAGVRRRGRRQRRRRILRRDARTQARTAAPNWPGPDHRAHRRHYRAAQGRRVGARGGASGGVVGVRPPRSAGACRPGRDRGDRAATGGGRRRPGDAAGVAADARHRLLPHARQPAARWPRRAHVQPLLRRRGGPLGDSGAPRAGDGHRRGRFRPAAAGRDAAGVAARCAVRHQHARARRERRRALESRGPAGDAAAGPDGPAGLDRLHGGRAVRPLDGGSRRPARLRPVHAAAERPRGHGRRHRGGPGQRRGGCAREHGRTAARLLRGPEGHGRGVPDDRRRALRRTRRRRHGGVRRHPDVAGTRQQRGQHRRREGLRRGGRGGIARASGGR